MKNSLDKLRYNDVWNIILYAIYKMTGDKEYSTLSELIYTLDKDSLFKLCETFGGMTIKIPTTNELKLMINALLAYQYINIDNKSFDEVYKELELSRFTKKDFLKAYNTIVEVLKNYE